MLIGTQGLLQILRIKIFAPNMHPAKGGIDQPEYAMHISNLDPPVTCLVQNGRHLYHSPFTTGNIQVAFKSKQQS